MKKLLLAVLSLLFALESCDKPYEFDTPIRLQSDLIVVAASAGETPVVVFANKTWSCRFEENPVWASLKQSSGKGVGQAVVAWEANTGSERSAKLMFSSEGKTVSMELVQKAGSAGGE